MKIHSRLGQLILVLAVLALLAALTITSAQAQTTAKEVRAFTNITAVAASSATNVNVNLPLRSGKNHWILTTFAASASDTDPVTFWFYPRPDGTNTLTTHPTYLSAAANGTTGVLTGTNLSGAIWDGCSHVVLKTISNAHASATVYVTNVWLINSR